MDVYTPATGLIIWQLVILMVCLGLQGYALVHLFKHHSTWNKRSTWAFLIIVLPLIGPVSYLVYARGRK